MYQVDGFKDTKYTMADVKKHNKKSDCWIVIDDKVYDVTDWLPAHPGGEDVIVGRCGKDATPEYKLRKRGGKVYGSGTPHSGFADMSLKGYLIGSV